MSINHQHKPSNKHTPLAWIPEDWSVLKLNEILEGGRLGGKYENAIANTGIPIIKMANVGRGKMNIDTVQLLPLDSFYNAEDILR